MLVSSDERAGTRVSPFKDVAENVIRPRPASQAKLPYVALMTEGRTYTPEQLHRIYNAHVRVCAMRGVELVSGEGKQIAKRLLSEFTGSEPEDDIVRKFLS
ncbi:hypothetical protein J2T09_003578 [Neorhizobium huautlense]|uniref:Uncharacterized protein n=1 Tax=Neorhizobium huautlense TaxID=67774 RepID=A0ABT9PXE6_9HYPH|nr:hypothetical protein [Neorhizobium huautlense]MDP9838806.1 hypothetical protein [Neorhizobium huautlense]